MRQQVTFQEERGWLAVVSARWFQGLLLVAVVLLAVLGSGAGRWVSVRAVQEEGTIRAVVSSASNEESLAPGVLATIYGENLATETAVAPASQETLGGIRVRVGNRPAQLSFVSPGQVNLLIPEEAPVGATTLEIFSGEARRASRQVQLNRIAPAVFTFNGQGNGVVAGVALRARGGEQQYESIAQYDAVTRQYRTRPIDPGTENERVFLVVYLSGLRRADPEKVKVVIGGDELTPLYAGTSGSPGLDQINVELPRTLSGRGPVKLAVSAIDATQNIRTSNAGELEIGGEGLAAITVSGFAPDLVLAGQTLVINGSGFPTADVEAIFAGAAGTVPEAVSSNSLTLRVPFGAQTGAVSIKAGNRILWQSDASVRVRTSVSGFIQDPQRRGIEGVRVELTGRAVQTTTNRDGGFILADVPDQDQEVKFTTDTILGPVSVTVKLGIVAGRDNQLSREEVQRIVASSGTLAGSIFSQSERRAAQADQISLELSQCPPGSSCPFTLTPFALGRTPRDLPPGRFSSAIAQVTPFGVSITPGGKLKFPNVNNVPPGTPLRVFRMDQKSGNRTLGEFIDIGEATVGSDGRLETASGAVTEGSYYFVSPQWPVATIIGHVVEADPQRPARRALVYARGQSTFTDANGGFVLRDVPVIQDNDSVEVEVAFHRPDGSVSRAPVKTISIQAGRQIQIGEDIKMPPRTPSVGPAIVAPATLAAAEGRAAAIPILVTGLAAGDAPRLINPPAFAWLCKAGSAGCNANAPGPDVYVLQLDSRLRSSSIVIAAGPVADPVLHTLTVSVTTASAGAPQAGAAGFVTDEDQSLDLSLPAGNVGGEPSYRIAQPLHGVITCLPANTPPPCASSSVRYRPAANYFGGDSFTFTVRTGNLESAPASVTIGVRPQNDLPVITAPSYQVVSAGQPLRLSVSAFDPDEGQTLNCVALNSPTGAALAGTDSPANWQFSWTPTNRQLGSLFVEFQVSDGIGATTHRTVLGVTGQWAQTSGIEGGTIGTFLVRGTTVFAGTVNGGLYRSTDRGANWTAVNRGLGNPNVRALVDFNGELFAGTDNGAYRSRDNGDTWSSINTGLPIYQNQRYAQVMALVVKEGALFAAGDGVYRYHPITEAWEPRTSSLNFPWIRALAGVGNVLYAGTGDNDTPGTGNGVYRSDNDGVSWYPVNTGIETAQVATLTADPGGNLYAGTEAGCFRLANGASGWAPFSAGLPSTLNGKPIQVLSLLANGSDLLAATYGLSATPAAGVFRFDSLAGRWMPFANGITNRTVLALAGGGNGLYAGTYGGGIFRSDDRGANWVESNRGLTSASIISLAVSGQSYFAAASNRGIFRSDNKGQSWTLLPNVPREFLFVRDLAVKGTTIFAALEAGGVYRSRDNGQTWTQVRNGLPLLGLGGRPFPMVTLAVDGNVIYAGGDNGIYASNNEGDSWTPISIGPQNITVSSIAARGATIYAGTGGVDSSGVGGQGVYRSTNGGASWAPIREGLPKNQDNLDFRTIRALAIVGNSVFAGTDLSVDAGVSGSFYLLDASGGKWDPINSRLAGDPFPVSDFAVSGEKFFVGMNFGGVHLSTDQGANFTKLPDGLPPDTSALSLALDGDALLAGTFGGVAILADQQETWQAASAGLGSTYVNTLLLDGGDLLVGTLGSGAYLSSDGARTWKETGSGLPSGASVQSLTASAAHVFAGTFSNGVYRADHQASRWEPFDVGLTEKSIHALLVVGTRIYAATERGVFSSPVDVANWSQVGNALSNRKAFSLAIYGTYLYAGTEAGVYRRLLAGAQDWEDASAGMGTSRAVRALAVNAGSLFAGALGDGIYRLGNNGSWVRRDGGLPAGLDVFGFAAAGTRIYAGTIFGVFYSSNNGDDWRQLNAGLSDLYVTALGQRRDALYVGTRLRGVFRLKVLDSASCRLEIAGQPASRRVDQGQSATLTVTVEANGAPIEYQWYRGASGDETNPISGATGASYVTPPLTTTSSYWVRARTLCNSIDSATATLFVSAPTQADLELTQSVSAVQVAPGGQVVYALSVRNKGPADAVSVAVTQLLPASFVDVTCAAKDSQGVSVACANGGRTVSFSMLPRNGVATVQLRGRVSGAPGETLSLSATVAALAPDVNPADNVVRSSLRIANDVPVLTSLAPASVVAGGPGFQLTLTGTGFVSGAAVRWNGVNRPTTFVSSTQLTAQIPAGDIAAIGVANVTVVNPSGAASGVQPLTIYRACTYTARANSTSFGAQGGAGSVTVETASGCRWTASSPSNDVSITSATSGEGPGVVTFTLPPNSRATTYVTSILVAGQQVLLAQAGSQTGSTGTCAVRSLTLPQTVDDSISQTDCGSSYFGSAYYADQYHFSARAGQRVTLSLTANGPNSYLFLIGPSNIIIGFELARIPREGASLILPLSGTYLIEVGMYSLGATGSYTLRADTIAESANCSYAATPSTTAFNAAGGTGTITVSAPNGCLWTANSLYGWATITSAAASAGNGSVNFTVQPNTTPFTRIGSLLVAGRLVQITQAGNSAACTVAALNPSQPTAGSLSENGCRSLGRSGGFANHYTFFGQAGQRIALRTIATAFTPIMGLFGPDSGLIGQTGGQPGRIPPGSDFLILPQTGSYFLEVSSFEPGKTGDYTLTISEAPATTVCNFGVSPSNRSFTTAGGQGMFEVTSPGGCGWAAESRASWIRINTGNTGAGNGSVGFTVDPNEGALRSGELLIAGQSVLVTQEGVRQ